jgi:threonine dehydrogenase-like Zn-dependent dehydrogenase
MVAVMASPGDGTTDDPTGWFERLYSSAGTGGATVPWDHGEPAPMLVDWAAGLSGPGRRAVVVGCGLGDDAEFVAGLGFTTVAFDVAPSAIAQARRRFPDSTVDYRTADLLALPDEWHHGFDLVVENFTVQSLPPALHARASAAIAGLVAPGGTLIVHASRGADDAPPRESPPWPLRRAEVEAFAVDGLTIHSIAEVEGPGYLTYPVWQAEFRH